MIASDDATHAAAQCCKVQQSHNEKVLECIRIIIMASRLQDANVPLDLRQIQWMIRKLDRNFTSIIKYRFDTQRN